MGARGITDVPGFKAGHYTDEEAATGCTVVLCEAGAVGGVDVRGSAPGTRETDLLRPTNLVNEVHAVLLSPNPPKDTDGRREESGRGVRELQGK